MFFKPHGTGFGEHDDFDNTPPAMDPEIPLAIRRAHPRSHRADLHAVSAVSANGRSLLMSKPEVWGDLSRDEKARVGTTLALIAIIAAGLIWKYQPFQPMSKRLAVKIIGVER
jgi:hypothetical protein